MSDRAPARVLLVEDDPTTAYAMRAALRKAGYDCDEARDGDEAVGLMRARTYEVVVTDWLMPGLNGIDLVREIRRSVRPTPLVVMVTSIDTDAGRSVAMMAGADEFLAKPVSGAHLVELVGAGLQRIVQASEGPGPLPPPGLPTSVRPPHPGLVLAASTGGPPALLRLLGDLPPNLGAAIQVVQHGPDWMLDQLARRIVSQTGRRARLDDTLDAEPGEVVLAPQVPGGRGADALLRRVAGRYGPAAVAVVLTGVGDDGVAGAREIRAAGGVVLVLDPDEAAAPGMPASVVGAGGATEIVGADALAARTAAHVEGAASRLRE